MEAARDRGALFDFIYYAVSRANLALRAGEIFEREADARSAYEIARGERWPLGLASIASYLVAGAGRARRAGRGVGGAARDPARQARRRALRCLHRERAAARAGGAETRRRGRARGARGPGGGADPAGRVGRAEPVGLRLALDDGARARWSSASATGRWSLPREEVSLAREWGAPRALGISLRVAGLVEGGDEGAGAASRGRRRAGRLLRPARARRGRSRTSATSRWPRCQRNEARELLREALELAHRWGRRRSRRGSAPGCAPQVRVRGAPSCAGPTR